MTEHGTRSKYVSGCRCEACTIANREYARRRSKVKAKEAMGAEDPYWQPLERAQSLIAGLIVRGYTIAELARLTGIKKETLYAINCGKSHHTGKGRHRVHATTVGALRAVYDDPRRSYAPRQLVDGSKTRAVVDYLVETYGRTKASALLGWDLRKLDNFRAHRGEKVRYETARDVMGFVERAHRAKDMAAKPKTWNNIKREREAAGYVVNPY